MRYIRQELFLACMRGAIVEGDMSYYPKDKAYEILKLWTGEDFGFDTHAWGDWFAEHGEQLSDTALVDAVWAVMQVTPSEEVDDADEIAMIEADIEAIKGRLALQEEEFCNKVKREELSKPKKK